MRLSVVANKVDYQHKNLLKDESRPTVNAWEAALGGSVVERLGAVVKIRSARGFKTLSHHLIGAVSRYIL